MSNEVVIGLVRTPRCFIHNFNTFLFVIIIMSVAFNTFSLSVFLETKLVINVLLIWHVLIQPVSSSCLIF